VKGVLPTLSARVARCGWTARSRRWHRLLGVDWHLRERLDEEPRSAHRITLRDRGFLVNLFEAAPAGCVSELSARSLPSPVGEVAPVVVALDRIEAALAQPPGSSPATAGPPRSSQPLVPPATETAR
jgi:hypothetical protein